MIETWVLVVACVIHVFLGIWLGLRIADREAQDQRDTRMYGPGLPTEESEADDWMKKGGW